MYYIASGKYKVLTREPGNFGLVDVHFRTFKKKRNFGEIALLYDCKRSATIMAENYGTMGVLGKE